MAFPEFTGAVQGQGRVGQFLHAFVAHLGQPELDGLGLGAGNGLDQAEEGFRGGDIGEVLLAIRSGELQSVTICNHLTTFLRQSAFQDLPVVSGGLVIRLLDEHLKDVDYREPPGSGGFVMDPADLVLFEEGGFRCHGFAVGLGDADG